MNIFILYFAVIFKFPFSSTKKEKERKKEVERAWTSHCFRCSIVALQCCASLTVCRSESAVCAQMSLTREPPSQPAAAPLSRAITERWAAPLRYSAAPTSCLFHSGWRVHVSAALPTHPTLSFLPLCLGKRYQWTYLQGRHRDANIERAWLF